MRVSRPLPLVFLNALNTCVCCVSVCQALMYAELALALLVQWLFGSGRASTAAVATILVVSCVSFWHFSAWVYASPQSTKQHMRLRWMSGWD